MIDTASSYTKDIKSVQGCNPIYVNRNNNTNIGRRLHVYVWYVRH